MTLRLFGAAVVFAAGWPFATSLPAVAAGPAAAPPAKAAGGGGLALPGTNSHQPISIDAAKLDYYDKQQKLVYTGSVVAVQGDSTLKASELIIYLSKDDPKAGAAQAGASQAAGENAAAAGASAAAPGAGSSVKHMDAKGPVTLVSKDQIGTGDNGSYDKDENKVTLTGNVTLSQGTNVTKGDKLVYDLTTGQAQVFSGQTYGRVKSIFTPGSGAPGAPGDAPAPAKNKPVAKGKPPVKPRPAGTASAQ
jgi:lipopolysaccharide export system protein LptA